MKRSLAFFLTALFYSLLAEAQPLVTQTPYHGNHHTHRLPDVNERRLARLEKMREANLALRHREGPWRAQAQPQTKKGLVLLVEFSDEKMKGDAAAEWQSRFNQQGFSQYNHVGSVRDYFLEQSYGLLNIDFDVIGPLELTKTRAYYGSSPNSNVNDRAAEMVIEALKLADSQVNYADYDWNDNAEVDQVYVIYAGMTSSTEPGYIWPHEWSLSSAKYYGVGSGIQRMDGVSINTYAVSNEMANETTLEGIGTACHEFSHCLGYPDFYDTAYTGGTAGQFWDLLDGGCYNGPKKIGETPSPYTAYERWSAGWIDLIPLTEPCKVSEMPAINEEGVAYVIKNTGNSNEYYILENRQQTTFGAGNRGHGLMVWHIDYNQRAWSSNKVNINKDHQRMTFLPADGSVGILVEKDYGYAYEISMDDEAGDPYPGLQNVTSVQQLTWFTAEKAGTKTHQNLIRNISETTDGKISFIYGDYFPLPTPELAQPTNVTSDSFTANWTPVKGAASYTLQVEAMTDEPTLATIFSEDFSGFASVGADAQVGSSVVNIYTQTAGWTISNIYGTAEASVRVGAAKRTGHVTTPVFSNRAGTLQVEFDAAYYNTDGTSIVVSVLQGAQTIAEETVQLTDSRATYSCTFDNIPSECQVRFATTAVKQRFYLYNVNIKDMGGTVGVVTTYTGLTSTSHAVGPVEAKMCYYRVQAACDDGTSKWSDWMAVEMASAINGISADTNTEEELAGAQYYDLSGRRLQHVPHHGIYIRNKKTCITR